jgi:hypothetical protein
MKPDLVKKDFFTSPKSGWYESAATFIRWVGGGLFIFSMRSLCLEEWKLHF